MARKKNVAREAQDGFDEWTDVEHKTPVAFDEKRITRKAKPKDGGAFWAKYKHPKWQAKRLRVMEAAGFMCEHCQDNESTLNVHHTYYERGANPWDYPDESLKCLCETCHKEAERVKREILERVGVMPAEFAYFVLGLCRGIQMWMFPAITNDIETGEVASGMLLAWQIHSKAIAAGTVQVNEIAKTSAVDGHAVGKVFKSLHR